MNCVRGKGGKKTVQIKFYKCEPQSLLGHKLPNYVNIEACDCNLSTEYCFSLAKWTNSWWSCCQTLLYPRRLSKSFRMRYTWTKLTPTRHIYSPTVYDINRLLVLSFAEPQHSHTRTQLMSCGKVGYIMDQLIEAAFSDSMHTSKMLLK